MLLFWFDFIANGSILGSKLIMFFGYCEHFNNQEILFDAFLNDGCKSCNSDSTKNLTELKNVEFFDKNVYFCSSLDHNVIRQIL